MQILKEEVIQLRKMAHPFKNHVNLILKIDHL